MAYGGVNLDEMSHKSVLSAIMHRAVTFLILTMMSGNVACSHRKRLQKHGFENLSCAGQRDRQFTLARKRYPQLEVGGHMF